MSTLANSRARLGEEAVLERNLLVRRTWSLYYQALLGFLRRRSGSEELAQDVAQEAFVRFCRQRNLSARIEGRERAYLFRTASNLLTDHFRRRQVRDRGEDVVGDLPWLESVAESTPQSQFEARQDLAIVKRTLLDMDPRWRRVFLARRLDGVQYRELARELEVSERTVERYMQRALERLEAELLASAAVERSPR